MRIVIDTSVLVAATRSHNGASFKLVSMLPTPKFEFALTVSLYMEWQAVLTRPEHIPPNGTPEMTLRYLRYLASISRQQKVYYRWRPVLSDPNDDMVLECAVSSGSSHIVTHNVKDFRRATQLHIQAISPAGFLELLRTLS